MVLLKPLRTLQLQIFPPHWVTHTLACRLYLTAVAHYLVAQRIPIRDFKIRGLGNRKIFKEL